MWNKFLIHSVSSELTINTIVANVDTCIQFHYLKAVCLQMSITDKKRYVLEPVSNSSGYNVHKYI